MKLNRRETVMLLNGLMAQQDNFHKENPNIPRAVDFTRFEDAYALVMEEQAANPLVMIKEYDDLFSKLIYNLLNELSPEDEELLNLPPTEVQ